MRWGRMWTAIAGVILGAAGSGRADVVLFSDNFNVSAGAGSTMAEGVCWSRTGSSMSLLVTPMTVDMANPPAVSPLSDIPCA